MKSIQWEISTQGKQRGLHPANQATGTRLPDTGICEEASKKLRQSFEFSNLCLSPVTTSDAVPISYHVRSLVDKTRTDVHTIFALQAENLVLVVHKFQAIPDMSVLALFASAGFQDFRECNDLI